MRRSSFTIKCLCLATAVLAGGTATAQMGPDVIVVDLPNTRHWGQVGSQHAYSVGTTSCNIGDVDLRWEADNNWHPVIGQNLYRLKDGRIELLGISWLKHGFVTIDNGLCGQCPGNGTGDHLSPGCSDPYGAGLNGSRGRLGPRYEVNAATGWFEWPFDDSAPWRDNLLARRIIVEHDDLDPALNAGALYFVEGQYVARDDAEAGNSANNQTYRRVIVSGSFSLQIRGANFEQDAAIRAWPDHGNGVNNPDPDVLLAPITAEENGLFWIASKASDNGDGTWHYEIAIQNLTSDRSGGSFTVQLPRGAQVTGTGFHDVDYHSGEPWLPDDWDITVNPTDITWSSPQTYGENPNSNALRWGTLYNFWFDVDAPPIQGQAELGLFKPGTPNSVFGEAMVPDPAGARGDLNCDGIVNAFDIEPFLLALFDQLQYGLRYPDCDFLNGDFNGNGIVDVFDIEPFLDVLFP